MTPLDDPRRLMLPPAEAGRDRVRGRDRDPEPPRSGSYAADDGARFFRPLFQLPQEAAVNITQSVLY